jgi:hypothetical protein
MDSRRENIGQWSGIRCGLGKVPQANAELTNKPRAGTCGFLPYMFQPFLWDAL